MSDHGRLLALDYGSHKVGVALSDPLRITASPLETFRFHSRVELGRQLAEILETYEVTKIVVGIPYTLAGGESETTGNALQFAEWIEDKFGLPVERVDERLTTRQAKDSLQQMGVKTGHNKDRVDAMAAAHLLRHYLDTQSKENLS